MITISFRGFLVGAVIAQWIGLPLLLRHQSDVASVLGRYSPRYAAAIGVALVLTLFWMLLLAFHRRAEQQIARFPNPLLIALGALALLGVALVYATGVEVFFKQFVALNAVLLVILLTYARQDGAIDSRSWRFPAWGVALVLFVPVFITILTFNEFAPDEADYTDYASSFFEEGMVYNQTWLAQPYRITPGWPWHLVAYGWLVETFGYNIKIGRVWNFAGYLLAFAGLFALVRHLYGRNAATVSTLAFALSIAFIPEYDFSPNHQLTIVSTWGAYFLFRARSADSGPLHFLTGLLVTLSLNVHAAGVVFAAAFSVFYAVEAAWMLYQKRQVAVLRPVIWFGGGALLGTVIYILANVLPVGGFAEYLTFLSARSSPDQYARRGWLFFLRWESLFEGVLFLAGAAYLLYRRATADRQMLVLLACVVLAAVALDSQGYIWHFGPLYFVAPGVLLTSAFATQSDPDTSWRSGIASGAVIVVLVVQMAAFVHWNTFGDWLSTGDLPPYLYDELKTILPEHVTEDDLVYSTHQLIWVFPHTTSPQLVSYAGELKGMARWGFTEPVQVWEHVQPTVIIFIENQMHFDPGMQVYFEQTGFETCEILSVLGTEITLYRPDCTQHPT